MHKYLVSALVTVGLMAGLVFAMAPVASAAPVDVFKGNDACQNSPSGTQICGKDSGDGVWGIVKNIINVLLSISGIVAVIMLIVGGINFITSNGDQAKVKKGRDTVLYSVVGLVVSILAFAIVNFVVDKL